jgi:hypothetical protein
MVALTLAGAGMPSVAVAAGPKKVTPADADKRRLQVQQSARPLAQSGDHAAAGIAYDNGAAEWGDPVLYLEAADSYLAAADAKRDEAMVDAAVERAKIALDILYFQLDAQADKDFRLVEQSDVPTLVARANSIVDEAEDLRAAIAAEATADPTGETEEPQKKKKPRKPGRAMIIAGASLTAVGGIGLGVGVAGLAIGAVNQNQAEEPTVYGEEYDAVEQKGKRGNVIAIVGLALGGAAAITGIVLIVLGKKKQRKAGGGNAVAVAPTLNGIAISGRF